MNFQGHFRATRSVSNEWFYENNNNLKHPTYGLRKAAAELRDKAGVFFLPPRASLKVYSPTPPPFTVGARMRGLQLTVAIALWLAPASRCMPLHNALDAPPRMAIGRASSLHVLPWQRTHTEI